MLSSQNNYGCGIPHDFSAQVRRLLAITVYGYSEFRGTGTAWHSNSVAHGGRGGSSCRSHLPSPCSSDNQTPVLCDCFMRCCFTQCYKTPVAVRPMRLLVLNYDTLPELWDTKLWDPTFCLNYLWEFETMSTWVALVAEDLHRTSSQVFWSPKRLRSFSTMSALCQTSPLSHHYFYVKKVVYI